MKKKVKKTTMQMPKSEELALWVFLTRSMRNFCFSQLYSVSCEPKIDERKRIWERSLINFPEPSEQDKNDQGGEEVEKREEVPEDFGSYIINIF